MQRLTLTALFALLLVSSPLVSQQLEVGPAVGVAYYNGDLNPGLPFQDVKPAYGMVVRFNNSTRWAYRLTLLNGQLATSGANARVDKVRGTEFTKNFQEAGVVAEFNFFDFFTGSEKNNKTPYLFVGMGVTRIDATTDVSGVEQTIWPFHTAFGAGFKYSLNNRLSVGAEWGMRRMFSDDIDHASTVPLNEQLFWDDPGKTDWYNFTGLSLTYRFSLEKKHECDAFQNRLYKK
ncbi:MAG TPA: DUF6089 family protein [Bacteroidales bacterium]|nr:DUF6089 family protein [Bacteroidales bacterium]